MPLSPGPTRNSLVNDIEPQAIYWRRDYKLTQPLPHASALQRCKIFVELINVHPVQILTRLSPQFEVNPEIKRLLVLIPTCISVKPISASNWFARGLP